jgi:hypothetical protein
MAVVSAIEYQVWSEQPLNLEIKVADHKALFKEQGSE